MIACSGHHEDYKDKGSKWNPDFEMKFPCQIWLNILPNLPN